MNFNDRARLSELIDTTSEKNMSIFLICSENSAMAADNLRAALTNLNNAHELMQQLLIAIRRELTTIAKEC